MQPTRIALALVPAAALVLLASARPQEPLQAPGEVEHAALAPTRALVHVELRDADGLFERGLEHPLARALLTQEVERLLEQTSGASPAQALALLDERAGQPLLPALAALCARGAALSVELRRAKPVVLVTLRGDDAQHVERVLEGALARAAALAGHPGALDAPSEVRGGTSLWRVGDALVVARNGAWVVASNDEDAVVAAFERAREGKGLADDPSFARARAARPDDAMLWAWADLERLRALQRIDDGDRGLIELAEAAAQPGAQLLLGPALALLGSARHGSLALCVRGEDVELRADGFEVADGAARTLLPSRAGSTAALGARDALRAALYRDLRGIFAARGELFGPRAQPGFAEAEGNLALFFGGRDVTEAVLPHLSPWVEVVAREVAFREGAHPDAALPAIAALVRVDDASIGADLVSAFQTAISLVNVDRAQKALPALRLELTALAGTTLTSARFAPPAPGTGVELRYNLEPACALLGDTFVVGTHRALVAELVGELADGRERALADDVSEHVRLAGAPLAELARSQRELLVLGRVLNEGRAREAAEGEIDLLLALLARVDGLSLVTARSGEDALGASLTLDLRAGGAQR